MSLRPLPGRSPSPRKSIAPDNRLVLSLAWAGHERRFAMPPAAFYVALIGLPALAAIYLAATAYLFFRDDVIAGLMTRQAHLQYAYEDRLAALRLQFDQVTSRQMLDQDSFEGKMRDIVTRQAQIETRAAVLASLTDKVGALGDIASSATTAIAKAVRAQLPGKPAASVAQTPAPSPVEAYAPVDNPEPAPRERPRPEDDGLRRSSDDGLPPAGARVDAAPPAALTLADAADPDMPLGLRVQTLAKSLESTEHKQVAVLGRLRQPAEAAAAKLDAAIAATGLSTTKLRPQHSRAADAVGGPFIPMRIDPKSSAFDAQLARTQDAVLKLDDLRRIVPTIPLRKPLAGELEQTSGFGYRVDPFLGRPALHSGLDFRGEYGAPVHATAGGVVVTAGPAGGYGNMVEIDHGNGLSTRYGHLSAILVTEGQTVDAGAVLGRVGSTGRSTGTHLHYEVRIDDEPVDPTRFIRAARMLAE